jgi:hypothetical protein
MDPKKNRNEEKKTWVEGGVAVHGPILPTLAAVDHHPMNGFYARPTFGLSSASFAVSV